MHPNSLSVGTINLGPFGQNQVIINNHFPPATNISNIKLLVGENKLFHEQRNQTAFRDQNYNPRPIWSKPAHFI